MSLSTSFRNIKITNNIIDLGFSSTGSASANYTYTSNMSLGGDAAVISNTFSGCIGNGIGSTNLISITAGSSNITNNNFIRGVGSPITTYIAVTSTTDQIIKNNIFDQSTVDGTSDVLVTGLTVNSIYSHNKNQIIYIPISAAGGTFTADTVNGWIQSDTTVTIQSDFNYLSIFIFSLVARQFYINYNLNSSLPDSVRILEAKVGIFNTLIGSSTLTSGTFAFDIAVDDVVPANYSTGLNSILDVKNVSSPLDSISDSIDLAANYAALQANTQYITLDVSLAVDPNYFINTRDKCITTQLYIHNDLAVLGSGQQWNISPIVVKCIW